MEVEHFRVGDVMCVKKQGKCLNCTFYNKLVFISNIFWVQRVPLMFTWPIVAKFTLLLEYNVPKIRVQKSNIWQYKELSILASFEGNLTSKLFK